MTERERATRSTRASATHGPPGAPGATSGTTLKDVAAAAGVSLKTASRVLNDDPKVADATRQLVRDTMLAMAYEPDPAARSLRAGRDRTVGVVVDSIGDIFFSELAATIETELDMAGYRCLLASSNRDPDRARDIVRGLVRRRCAGVIVAPTTTDSISAADLARTPIVYVDRVGGVEGAVSVVSDDFGLARNATRHLLNHRHRRIALLCDSLGLATTARRKDGYRQAFTDAGVDVDDAMLRTGCNNESQAMDAVRDVLALDDPATAIFCTSSRLTLGVVPALHQFDRSDVALVSFGDFVMAESVQPAVTVIDHSAVRIGTAAVAALLAELPTQGEPTGPSRIVEVPARLIARGTGEISAPSHIETHAWEVPTTV